MERFNFVARILHPRTSEFLNRISTVLGSRIRPSNIVFYVGRVHILEAFTPQGGVDEGEKRVRERIRKERERETIQGERCAPRRALALLRIQECCRVSYFRHPSFPYSRQQVTWWRRRARVLDEDEQRFDTFFTWVTLDENLKGFCDE